MGQANHRANREAFAVEVYRLLWKCIAKGFIRSYFPDPNGFSWE